MFSIEPAKLVGRCAPSPVVLTREYQVCSSRSAIWPSHISVARLLMSKYWPSPLLWSEYSQTVSTNSGLLVEGDRWRLWYTVGTLGPAGERLRVDYAESKDRGLTWNGHRD